MADIPHIDADLPMHRTAAKFRNHDKPCLIMSPDKAKSDAKNFREAAGFVRQAGSDRAKLVAEWLEDLAGKFENIDG